MRMNLFSTASKALTHEEGSSPAPATETPRAGPRRYFAYGSNLHVTQMAQRCPHSVFLGKATLPGYRWQINQRGVANVVESLDDCVEGLVFLVNPRDEKALDRSEGVSRSLYVKKSLPIIYEPHERYCNSKSSQLAQQLARPLTPEDPSRSPPSRPRNKGPHDTEQVEALVYVSEKFKLDGRIRDEYIQRMENAASDAITLGVSPSFIDRVIRPHIIPRPSSPPSTFNPSALPQSDPKEPNSPPKTQPPTVAATPPLILLDLAQLRHENRNPHISSGGGGLRFSTEMLNAISPRPTAAATTTTSDARIYLVLVKREPAPAPMTKPGPGPGPGGAVFYVQTSTRDAELANELAMATFRDIWARAFGGSAAQEERRKGSVVSWRLTGGEDGGLRHLHLSAALAGGEKVAEVWVEGAGVVARA